jgi:low affinity Fe/Cu permease
MMNLYKRFAKAVSEKVGSSGAFLMALLIILVWGATGPVFHYSDSWQLVINTGTTIITFLMVFLIQYAQNRDSKTTHLKLDELINSARRAHNEMLDLDRMSDEELAELEARYKRISDHAVARRNKRSAA